MSIQEIVKILTESGIEKNEANIEVKLLIEHFCGITPVDIIMGKRLDENKLRIVKEKALFRARTGTPIQYILGWSYFMGEKFVVTKDTLIPRDETELSVRRAVDIVNSNNFKKILDIGTGTGCIACMIAKSTLSEITAVDILDGALAVANVNAANLGLLEKIRFIKSDIFSNILQNEKFDVIISNPPYIPKIQKATIQKEVTFEPDAALYTDDEKGLDFYKRIIKESKLYLNKGGYIIFELGINQSEDVKRLLAEFGYTNIEIEKDLAEIPRVISAKL